MRRTKIVATLGPASRRREVVESLIGAGANVFRLNSAHGTPDVHTAAAQTARAAADEMHTPIGLLVDLPGPKLRSGPIEGDEAQLDADQEFVLGSAVESGDRTRVGTTVDNLADLVSEGDEIFLADGAIVLVVESVRESDVLTRVLRGGTLRSRKGMHLPRAEAGLDPFTDADEVALRLALRIKADFVGLSFVREAADVERIRERLPKRGRRPQLVAKVETASALANLSEIVAAADAVMVARGDLAIQVSADRVPLLQKEIIRRCNRAGRPVITATQMLESMTHSPLPTRAEVNDVANAVIDGTDALMLSEETAVGERPVEAVEVMAQTALTAETWPRHRADPDETAHEADPVAWAVAHAALAAAEDLRVAAVLCPTRSGATARSVAAFRPPMPIIGASSQDSVLGGLCLAWGVVPLKVPDTPDLDDLDAALRAARARDVVRPGDLVAAVGAWPGRRAGSTDYVRIVRVERDQG